MVVKSSISHSIIINYHTGNQKTIKLYLDNERIFPDGGNLYQIIPVSLYLLAMKKRIRSNEAGFL